MTEVSLDHALQLALKSHQAGRLGEAENIYRQILQQQPDSPDTLHLLGLLLGQRNHLPESVEMIRKAIGINPKVAAFHCNLGESYRRMRKFDDAIAAFNAGLKLDNTDAVAHSNLAAALRDKGEFDKSIAECRIAIKLSPNLSDAHSNLGNALKDQGKFDQAIEACKKAISLQPTLAEAHNTLGSALLGKGKLDEAIESFHEAAKLKPTLWAAHNNLGNALRGKRQFDQAIQAYHSAISLNPDSPDAWYNLGIALKDMGKLNEAIVAYSKAIALKPDHAEAHNNLGNVARFLGDLDRAFDCFTKAIESDPQYAEAYNNLGSVYTDQGRLDQALEQFRKSIALRPNVASVHSNYVYTMHFHANYDAKKILEECMDWSDQFEAPLASQIRPHKNDRDPARILKIGYVSPDFRTHAAACFLLPLLANHDTQTVEIYCYAGVKRPDATTAKMQQLNHHWRNTIGMSDADLAEMIRKDQIDILVDLTLHMADNRLLTFARKPATVAVTWLGYPSTTGMTSIDYRFTDKYLDPALQFHQDYTERSIRLPNSFWCYQPLIENTPDVNELPAIKNGYITFGCFNNFAKVTPQTLHLWNQVFAAVPDSRLLIQSNPGKHRDEALSLLSNNDVSADRIEYVPKAQPLDYFKYYHRVDLCLDPIPYPGHTTSLDALWMGIPSVTLSGRTAASRGGVSILSNVGLPEFIARTQSKYVAIAAQFAADPHHLATIRATLRAELQSSPLMDAKKFAVDLESIYRKLWQTWCSRAKGGQP